MLTISKPLTTGQAHSYHREEFANPEQNYYTQGARTLGEWHGKLAGEWGLAGKVSSEQFHRLAQGQHPETGEQLVRHRFASEQTGKKAQTAEHRAGWDATFSAPKSVSITALVGGDRRVREAHGEAVRVALNELERYIQARIGGNHPAETTGKMIAAKFEHDSARPVNGYSAPQLHTHVVIFNITQTPDGKPHALQPRELHKSQAYSTAIYRSELADRLRKLGYELERGKEGEFEIKGYTKEYIEASSPRRKQIKEYLEAHKVTGAEASEMGAHQTRGKKINLTPHEMQAVNEALAAQYGNDPKAVVMQAQARRRHVQEPVDDRAAFASAQAAVTYARDRNIEREAVVEERLLIRDALKRAMGEATLDQIRANLDKRIESSEFVEVRSTAPSAPHRSLTTRQMLEFECQNIGTMTSGQGSSAALVHERNIPSLFSSEFRHLSDAQRRAVIFILESHDKIAGFQGIAGSGKTTTLSAIRRAAENDGFSVRGFAPTSRAAHGLEKADIASTTLQQFLIKGGPRQQEPRRVYVLGESSLASTVQVNQFFKRLRPDDRVLLVGDIRQHQAVDAGKPFEQFQQAGMRTARLEEIVRPKDPDLKAAIESFASEDVKTAIELLQSQGRIHQFPDKELRLQAITADYLRAPDKTLVVSPDNESRLQINRQIHLGLQAQGTVAKEEVRVSVLTNRHELTGADRQWAAKYQVGDVIRYTRGSARFRLKAEEYAYVTQVNTHENTLTVQRKNGQETTYDPRRLQGVNVYKREERQFAVGDRIQFTAPFKKQHIPNRTLAHVEKIGPDGNIQLRLDGGKTARFNLREHVHLDYGYAMTSYTSQGQTVDRVIVHVPAEDRDMKELINQRFGYVALSRARHDAQIYTNDAGTLTERLGREVSKTAAIENRAFSSIWPCGPPPESETSTGAITRMTGFELILPFLRPIEHLILDPDISEIMLNGPESVFIERNGYLKPVPDVKLTEKSLMIAVKNIARRLGDDISEAKPILDSRLPDGSRVAAVIPPCSVNGVTLTIRKFNSRQFALDDLIRTATLPECLASELIRFVRDRKNILITGGTGTGKTTLLNALASYIPDEQRLVFIEDTAEIQIQKPNLVRLEARGEQLDIPAVTIRDLLKATLRHRPDRIILGEIRGGEAFDLLQLLNTGHSGTLSTVHANSAAQGLARFTSCVLQSGIELPYQAIKSNIADSLNVIVQIERRPGQRFVSEVLEIRGYNPDDDRYDLQPVYTREESPCRS